MGDLYFDDIEDRSYTDQMILADVEALVKSGQREGSVVEYKSDLSELDNWPQTVAAFANSFGGLIVFGVEGKNDQPRRVSGFDPKGVEIKTKITSMVIDRIQPRPDFSVRVVTYDKDPTKEVALLRVSEGPNPPYMHSKDQEHRVYVRIGAQKAEVDYLQLTSLFEKRRMSVPPLRALTKGPSALTRTFSLQAPKTRIGLALSFFGLCSCPPMTFRPYASVGRRNFDSSNVSTISAAPSGPYPYFGHGWRRCFGSPTMPTESSDSHYLRSGPLASSHILQCGCRMG